MKTQSFNIGTELARSMGIQRRYLKRSREYINVHDVIGARIYLDAFREEREHYNHLTTLKEKYKKTLASCTSVDYN